MTKIKNEKKPSSGTGFGERVRAIRKSLKMKQKDFAKGIHTSLTHLSDIETGKTKPCHDFFYHIVKSYQVNLNYLLFGEGEMFSRGGSGEIVPGKNMKTGDKNMDEFLYYLFNSQMVQSYILYTFFRFYHEEEQIIIKDLNRTPGEEKPG